MWSRATVRAGEIRWELSETTAADYLASVGLLPQPPVEVRALGGGVSGEVFAVTGPSDGLVVKQARLNLKVAGQWTAKRERTWTEARALQVVASITPRRVPQVILADRDNLIVVVELAPRSWRNMRDVVRGHLGDTAAWLGSQLGETLAMWHAATWVPWPYEAEFTDSEAFEQLRLGPFHGEVARKHPDLAEQVLRHAEQLRTARICLVHGDFSPKNILVGPRAMWVVDFEVAHFGHPVFDVAFMGAHLALGCIANPTATADLGMVWTSFCDTYFRRVEQPASDVSIAGHLGCVLLARADGMSPEPGLNDHGRDAARRLGTHLVLGHLTDPAAVWDEVVHAVQ